METPSTQKKSWWSILKPFLTLGLSLLVGFIASKSGANKEVVQTIGTAVSSEVVSEFDELLNDTTVISK